jgi:hypothetical protein
MSSNQPNYSALSGTEDQEQDPWRDAQSREREGVGGSEEIHLATIQEKKRLWWKNSVINVLFMLSWCVLSLK